LQLINYIFKKSAFDADDLAANFDRHLKNMQLIIYTFEKSAFDADDLPANFHRHSKKCG
jgi:hypothetical protein